MDLSPAKCEILRALLINGEPAKAAQVANEVGNEFKSVNMHLIGLARMGYANSPEKGTYAITEKGKVALGLPEINREKAISLLAKTPREKAFHFYAGIGKPLNLYAHDLPEFCERVAKVGTESVWFHVNRGDFEAWFAALGDAELSRKIALLKERKLSEEDLRVKLGKILENRCSELSKKAKNTV